MANVKRQCSDCGKTVEADVGQRISRRLSWWLSISCPHCGARMEVDGGDDTPHDVRAALLAEGGLWALCVEASDGPAKLVAAAALRPLLRLSAAGAAAMKDALPCEVTSGTREEMEVLAWQLQEQGVHAHLGLLAPGPQNREAAKARPSHRAPCVACGRKPETRSCKRCAARICQTCRAPEHCAVCSFEMVRRVLAGHRVPGPDEGEAKALRAQLREGDLTIEARRIEGFWDGRRRPFVDFAAFIPYVVGEMLDRAKVARLDGPMVAALSAAPLPHFGCAPDIVDLCAWFLPEGEALRILLRRRTEVPASPRPIPGEGPFALPEPLPPWTPAAPRFRDEQRTCPHCQVSSARFRELDKALVCPACAMSFKA